MITTTQNGITIGKAVALGFLLAALIAMVLSAAAPSAGTAEPSGKAFGWGTNDYGELGNGASGPNVYSDVPVAVKNLTNVKNIDGSNGFTLATTQ